MTITTSPVRSSAGGALRFTGRVNGCDEHSRFQAGCTDCVENSRAWQQFRRRAIAYGQWQPCLVDADPSPSCCGSWWPPAGGSPTAPSGSTGGS
ncbi:hypothetical protein [Micromonospora chersina]|uniref:hypothetical protein n=1 Tax=Micromonospora chersina TaxID=47854 RepID=UPI0033B667FD